MNNKKVEVILILLFSVIFSFMILNIYAVIRLNQLKKNAYRSHDKFTIPEKGSYVKNINSQEINLYGDLCAIEGSYDECSFSNGKRIHDFSTDRYGFKTTSNINNSKLIIIGDSFLAASGGDNMNQQFGNIIGNLISKEVYQAAHPGGIADYNERHNFFKGIKPKAKFLYLLYEGNDFHSFDKTDVNYSVELMELPKTKPYHYLREYYAPFWRNLQIQYVNLIYRIPLYKLIRIKFEAINSANTIGTDENQVFVQKLPSGRNQAFYKPHIKVGQMMRTKEYSYISNNADSICGIIYVPTSYTTYLSKDTLKQKHPTLSRQLDRLQKLGIDVVDLTSTFQRAADNEQKENPIWWSDDTHWNNRGIRIGAETSMKLIKCLGK